MKAASSPMVVKTPISGVGDDAFYSTMRTGWTTLTVKKGDTYFVVRRVRRSGSGEAEGDREDTRGAGGRQDVGMAAARWNGAWRR